MIREELAPAEPDEDEDLDDDGTPKREYKRKKINQSIRFARRNVIPHFETSRAENASYKDEVIFDILARMCAQRGSSHSEGEYAWLTDDDYTPVGSTILRAIKNIGSNKADEQLTLEEAIDAANDELSQVKAIRDAVLEPFNIATDNIIASINGDDPLSDRQTIAAIDITYEQIHISP